MRSKEYFREWQRKQYKEKWKPAYDAFIPLYPFTTESLDGEIWLPIPEFEELYHCSNFGRVKSFWFGREKIRTPHVNRKGYLCLTLCKDKKQKEFKLHRLVAQLFIPNPENLPEVDHRYGMKFDNYVDNLRWATSSENQRNAYTCGLKKAKRGEENVLSKLTNEQVIYIRENPDGLNQRQIAEKFGVSQSTIKNVQIGKTYRDIGGPIRKANYQSPDISVELKEKILARYEKGSPEFGSRALARQFGISASSVLNIVHAAQSSSKPA